MAIHAFATLAGLRLTHHHSRLIGLRSARYTPKKRCSVARSSLQKNNVSDRSANETTLRQELRRRSTVRRVGLAVSSLVVAVSGIGALSSGVAGTIDASTLAALPGPLGAFVLASALTASRTMVFEVDHRLTPYVQLRTPELRPLMDGSVEVNSTGDARGRGAFAVCDIACNTALGWYEGELLDTAAFLMRYPASSEAPEYAIAVDSEYVIDGRDVAKGCEFTPAHMNHASSTGLVNVRRVHHRWKRQVMFYTTKDVRAGDELLFDYGRAYWKGREHLVV